MKQSAQLKTLIGAIRIAVLDAHGAPTLMRLDADMQKLITPIVDLFEMSKDKTLSEDEQSYSGALAGVAVMELSRIMSESQGD